MAIVVLAWTGWCGIARAAGSAITLQLRNVEVSEALKILAEKGDLNIAIGPNVQGKVNLFVEDISVRQALYVIVETGELAYIETGGIIQILTAKDYEQRYGRPFQDRSETRVFKVVHAQANAVQQALLPLKSPTGELVVDARSNCIVVVEQPEIIARMEGVLDSLDVATSMRAVQLRHVSTAAVTGIIQKALSPAGRLETDPARNRVIVWDLAPRVDQVVELIRQYDEEPYTETRTFALSHASAEDVGAKIQKELTQGIGIVRMDPLTHSLIVTDLPGRLEFISGIVQTLDMRRKQVLIETKIVQIALKDQYKLGIDWQYLTQKLNGLNVRSQLLTLGEGEQGVRLTSGVLAKDNYTALLELLEEVGKTNVLSTPRITVVDGKKANILVGSKVPYKTVDLRESDGVLNRFERVTMVDVGVQLYVTPRIGDDGFIQMEIRPEVSSVLTFSEGIPVVETSQANTQVVVKEGTTIILAGLIKDDLKETVRGIPLVTRVPLVGKLFSSTDTSLEKSELAFFITPQIVSGAEEVIPQGAAGESPEAEREKNPGVEDKDD